ncbi:MAG: asparagine synthase (glutamine-hydrolyzing) [Pseudomonadota bacterium]
MLPEGYTRPRRQTCRSRQAISQPDNPLMCGIAGVLFHVRQAENAGMRIVRERTALISHRGPDFARCMMCDEGRLFLGHARLSIIDPSPANNQPFEADGVILIFNGEIYNFKDLRSDLQASGVEFHTVGDSEVIARGFRHWGVQLFERLKGMYAIALYDLRSGHLYLARDVFGIKPLYYRQAPGEFSFASEIKGLSADRSYRYDFDAFTDLLTFGYQFGVQSAYEGVLQIEPGSVLVVQSTPGGVRLQHTQAKTLAGTASGGAAPDAEALKDCLRDSVERHLQSDVPVAISLSGGLDSSAVTALAAPHSPQPGIYTNSFFHDLDDDPEVHHAKLVCERHDLPINVIQSRVDSLEHSLSQIMWHLEEPVANSAHMTSFFAGAAIAQAGYKVALVGEGSDELFAGYPWHPLGLPHCEPEGFADLFVELQRQRAMGIEPPAYLRPEFHAPARERIERQRALFSEAMSEDVGSTLNRFLLFDIKFQLQFGQLQRVDRLFMAHGVEARVPFLYDDVLRAAFALPDRAKLSQSEAAPEANPLRPDKLCLAEAMGDLLPLDVLTRPKFGKRGTPIIISTPAMEGLPKLYRKVLTSSEYQDVREVLGEWIDLQYFQDEEVVARLKMMICLHAFAVEQFVLGGGPR